MMSYIKLKPTPRLDTAGGIVLLNQKILFIKKRGIWDLPKGKIEFDDSIDVTALREIHEETGLELEKLDIIGKLPSTKYYIWDGKDYILKKNFWRIIVYRGLPDVKLIPDQLEGITKCRWKSITKISKVQKKTHSRISYLIDYFLNDPNFEIYLKESQSRI
jgi:8-oxo-dGTP pyrophosphatase MutT (NUDIX family)